MPLTTPYSDESESDFVRRCVVTPTMVSEFPDRKQRVAVCHSQFSTAPERKRRYSTKKFIEVYKGLLNGFAKWNSKK
jgi:hypothetical protein